MALPKAPAIFREACLLWMPLLMSDFGFDELDAAAVMGNCGHESNGLRAMQELKPTSGRGGLGAFQWTGPRRRLFESWLSRKKARANDLKASYAFLFRELKGPEKKAIAATKRARGLEKKVEAFELAFERAGVKHYPSRNAWAQVALQIYREAHGNAPAPAAVAEPAEPPPPVVTVAVPETEPTWWQRLLGLRRPGTRLTGTNKGDETLFRAQNQLLAAGYVQVGEPDGLWGSDTRGAVEQLLGEQFPEISVPTHWPMSNDVLAAISKAAPRRVSAARAGATLRELNKRGAAVTQAPKALVTGGGILASLGLGKIGELTGLPGKLTAASDQASQILGAVQTAIGVFGTAIELAFRCWWVLALAGGIWAILKGVRCGLEMRALWRQGSIRQAGL